MANVVLVGGDLMARSRVEAAASAGASQLFRADPDTMVAVVTERDPDILILDLDGGREKALEGLETLRARGVRPRRVVGYFSHIDNQLGQAAREAGCEAMARSRFWRSLPELLAPPAPG